LLPAGFSAHLNTSPAKRHFEALANKFLARYCSKRKKFSAYQLILVHTLFSFTNI